MKKTVFFKTLSCLVLTCLIAGLAGCAKKEAGSTVAGADKGASQSATRTIVDQVGNTVHLPEKIERVVIASVWPLASVYCQMFGTDKLVGLDPAIVSAAENSMLIQIAPDIGTIETGFSKNGSLNAEELLALDPDVVLYSSGVTEDYNVATQAGIPAVGFSLSIKDYNAVETIHTWIEQLAAVMGIDPGDNSAYLEYGRRIQQLVAERIATVPEEERPQAMFIHRYDNATLAVPGSGTWADYWITASGARNVAAENTGTPSVSIEQIYSWNPERIYITNFNDALPEDLYGNTLGGHDWSAVKAVQDQQVKKIPLGIYRWYVTNTDSPLMLLWMAKQHHPDLFADIDLDKTVADFYKEFYNLDLTADDIQSIWNPVREAAGGA
ncbi:MAG: ABC transporter substrate-binding protein [Spirochaetaceae bacterium]|nr:ABC transporter substrate-binding protein [Spirochaetaceae bacterium]